MGARQQDSSALPTISVDLLKKTFTTVPKTLSPAILSLCDMVSPNHAPIWVPVRADQDAIESECFNNVSAKVTREGGAIVYGWLIWEWSRIFVEAEHHAVWESDGNLLDVTPHVNGEPKVLLLPDPSRVYDYESKKRIVNVKRSLGQFASVDRWIEAADTLQRTMEEHSVGNQIRIDRTQLSMLMNDLRNTQAAVLVDLAGC